MANNLINRFRKGATTGAQSDVSPGDVSVPAEVGASSAATVRVQQDFRSNRGRRIMVVVLILLLILLLLATGFLYNMVRPKGDIASGADSGGIEWVRSIYGFGPAPTQQLFSPASVALRDNGDILIPNVGGEAVATLEFNSSGVYTGSFAGSPDVDGEESVLRYPTLIEVAPDGKIYVLQRNTDQVLVLSPDGKETLSVFRVQQPMGLAVSDDRIAIGSRGGWVVTDLDFNVLVGPVGSVGKAAGQYDGVTGLAFDDDDNLYVVDSYNNRLSKFDEAGSEIYTVVMGAAANQSDNSSGVGHTPTTDAPAELAMPVDAVFDNAGRLLIVDTLGFSIAAFNPEDGSFIDKWGEPGTKEGELMYPASIDYDPVRDWVVVADTNNHRVQVLRLPNTGDGALGAVARALTGPLRACFIPLFLLLVALAVWLFMKWRERRRNRELERQSRARAEGVAAAVVSGELRSGAVAEATDSNVDGGPDGA